MEGDYVDYYDKDGYQSRWIYDRGYLCCLSKHGLRLTFRGRRYEYGTPYSTSAILPAEFDGYSTLATLIGEIEYRIQNNMNVVGRERSGKKKARAKYEWQ